MKKGKPGSIKKKSKSTEREFTCRCKYPLTDANFSTVRNSFFCPRCASEHTIEELESIMWGIA